MKILGKTNGSEFIVLMRETELANVCGHSYSFPSNQRVDVGSEIDVSKLWFALSVERGRQDELTKLANSLRKVAENVDKINAALDCPIVESKT